MDKRKRAYLCSELPYCFSYKIKNAFYGKICPICGCEMKLDREFGLSCRIPTIQHNKPISLGGEHCIENISVICKQCNVSLKNTPTDDLNNKEVVEVWRKLNGLKS